MNNNQKLLLGGLLSIGLIGLGYLGYQLLKEEETAKDKNESVKKPLDQPSAKLVAKELNKVRSQEPLAQKATTQQQPSQPIDSVKQVVAKPSRKPAKKLVYSSDEFPLKLGSKGKNVERLKVWLQRNYGTFGIINDEFDHQLEKIVIQRFKKPHITAADFKTRKMGHFVDKQSIIQ